MFKMEPKNNNHVRVEPNIRSSIEDLTELFGNLSTVVTSGKINTHKRCIFSTHSSAQTSPILDERNTQSPTVESQDIPLLEASTSTSVFNQEPIIELLEASTVTSAFNQEPIIEVGTTTRKKFREHVEQNLNEIQEKGQIIFDNVTSLEQANFDHTETIDAINVTYKLVELIDGGLMIKVRARAESMNEKLNLSFASTVYLERVNIPNTQNASLEKFDIPTAKLAMEDAIRLLPEFVYGSAIEPVSEYSNNYFSKRFLSKNQQFTKRYENHSLFCHLCELHVKNVNVVLDHIRSFDHTVLKMRYFDRYKLCMHWHNYPPTAHFEFITHIRNVQLTAQQQMQTFYQRANRVHVEQTLRLLENFVEGYTMKFYLFGSYETGLLTIVDPVIDCFIQIKRIDGSEPNYAEKIRVFKKLPFQFNDRYEHSAFQGYICNWGAKYFREKFFFTFDPKAWNAVLSTKLIALYAYICPTIRALALVFRQWAKNVGFLQQSNDYRISGSIFDYMVIHFLQKYHEVPVIDEEKIGCSIEEFLQKNNQEQLLIITPYFNEFFMQNKAPHIVILFTNLFLYYGCGFDYKNSVQITSVNQVPKENKGFRTVKIMDPISPTSNIFSMRPEHAIHLDNMMFYSCCELLQPHNCHGFFENIAVESISGSGKDFGFPYLVLNKLTGKNSFAKNSGLGAMFRHGLALWQPEMIPRVDLKCQFCRKPKHTERGCNYLKLNRLFGKKTSIELYSIFSMTIMKYFDEERITEDHLLNAKAFIIDLESRIFASTNTQIKLQSFGSLESGFGSKSSDLDLCLKLSDGKSIDEKEGVELLLKIGDTLLMEAGFTINYVFGAKVPILKFKFTGHDQPIEGDISFSNQLALRNTKLLAVYANFDERVAPLGIALKKWAKDFGINNSASHTLSSYALIIMLIHFLQRVEPPVLPYLQDENEFDLVEELIDEHEVQFAVPSAEYIKNFTKNKMSIGELFIRFFYYFGAFNWQENVIQIRSVEHPHKMDKGWPRSTICIEDPFDLSHNLSANVRLSYGLFIFKCINAMEAEFCRYDSVFSNGFFDFNSDVFKTLFTKMNTKNNSMNCYRCGQIGHFAGRCPNENFRNGMPTKSSNDRSRTNSDNVVNGVPENVYGSQSNAQSDRT